MSNPMLEHLGNSGGIMGMINMIRGSKNPQQMINNLAQTNPQMQQVMTTVNQYGGDPKKAFYAIAKERGVDPNSILSMLR